jgi:hypothetical protein
VHPLDLSGPSISEGLLALSLTCTFVLIHQLAAESAIQNEVTKKMILTSNFNWPGREGSNLRMAESKSDEYVSKINERSEFSSSVRPMMALGNFLRSECHLSCIALGLGGCRLII